MSEPATRTPDLDERSSAPRGDRRPPLSRTSPTLRVAGTIPADVDHMELSRDVRAPPPERGRGACQRPRLRAGPASRVAAGPRPGRAAGRDLHRPGRQGPDPGRLRLQRGDGDGARLPAVRVPRDGADVRAQQPLRPAGGTAGLHRDRGEPLPDGVCGVRVRDRERPRLQLLLHLLRQPVLRARSGSPRLRWVFERITGLALRSARLRAARGCSSAAATRSTPSRMRCSPARSDPRSSRSATSRSPRSPRTACATSARSSCREDCCDEHRVQEVLIADPDFPQEQAVELVDRCHVTASRCGRAPPTMEIMTHRPSSSPASRCRCSS